MPTKSSKKGLLILVAALVATALVVTVALIVGKRLAQNGNGKRTYIDNVSVGDCFNFPDSTDTSGNDLGNISDVYTVSCDEPHDGEVFVNQSSDGMTEITAQQKAQELCLPTFGQYVGRDYSESVYDVGYIWPQTGATNSYFTCYVTSTDGSQLTGSAKGTNR
jgi:hypothetical protein